MSSTSTGTADRSLRRRRGHQNVVPQPPPGTTAAAPFVVRLVDERAVAPALTGAKAAALAAAANAGLPILPGAVITTAATDDFDEALLHQVWSAISEGGVRSLVVRSSSTIEDSSVSSMAGMFTSVLDVAGPDRFREAVLTVLASGTTVPLTTAPGDSPEPAPMAVLVQPYITALAGGVMFGVDPISGRRDRLVVAASGRGPAAVVGGEVDATRYTLSRRGRLIDVDGEEGSRPLLTRRQLRALASLARRAQRQFGGPQDIEWAIDSDGKLWLLQSRPITAVGDAAQAHGPTLGPGPVAETFSEALSPLEEDLWLEPLRDALSHALALAGTASRRRLAASPVVVSVNGRLAADLDILGVNSTKTSLWSRIDPRPPVRRLVAAWRVGRLRAALPGLASDLIEHADSELLAVPRLDQMSDRQLLRLLGRSGQALAALHGHEVLMGWLVTPGANATTAASVAIRLLADARSRGLTDEEILVRHPSVLSLVSPQIVHAVDLPPSPPLGALNSTGADDRCAMLREALRLRARWVHELTARAAWELGERLAARQVLASSDEVRELRLEELRLAIRAGVAPDDLHDRRRDSAAPLPARFKLTPDGGVVAVRDRKSQRNGAVGAGGGRRVGTVYAGDGAPPAGSVLVVSTLEPGLASVLPGLAGLVAETGSPLSHLAILARELGVATVVGLDGALDRFSEGTSIVVDGTTGEVSEVGGPALGQTTPVEGAA